MSRLSFSHLPFPDKAQHLLVLGGQDKLRCGRCRTSGDLFTAVALRRERVAWLVCPLFSRRWSHHPTKISSHRRSRGRVLSAWQELVCLGDAQGSRSIGFAFEDAQDGTPRGIFQTTWRCDFQRPLRRDRMCPRESFYLLRVSFYLFCLGPCVRFYSRFKTKFETHGSRPSLPFSRSVN